MNFRRLTVGHWLAFVASLGLLLAMAPDWYTDKVGEQRREVQEQIAPQLDRQTTPTESQKQAEKAEEHEKNAWQAPAAIDRVILLLLLVTAVLGLSAAFVRASGHDVGPPSLSALATVTGLAGALLVAYRILQPPGFNEAAVVKWGAPVGLACVGLVALGSRIATLREREPVTADDEEQPAPDSPASPTPAG